MPETITAPQTAPSPAASVVQAAPVQVEQPKPTESLITRASKVIANPEPAKGGEETIKLDQAAIDKIADPVLKSAVQEAYKSMQADYTRKTQTVAELKRQSEQAMAQAATEKYNFQQLLSDPKWVQAAQEYGRQMAPQTSPNSTLTDEEFSYLTPEQQKLYRESIEAKSAAVNALQAVNMMRQQAQWQQEDTQLGQKYGAHYKPEAVTQVYQDMMSGKVQATREHLFRVLDYEDFGKRCYELGQQDRKLEIGEKLNATSSPNGVSVTSTNDVPVRLPNESGVDYFKRIALGNAAKLMKK